MRPFSRVDLGGRRILKKKADLFLKEVKDPRLQRITLHRVRVRPDLEFAQVFFSLLGGVETSEELQEVEAALKRVEGFLRRRIGKELRIRKVPRLEFIYLSEDMTS